MAALTQSSIPPQGFNGVLGNTAAGGDDFAVSEGDLLVFDNNHTVAITVTLVAVAASLPTVGGFPAAIANQAFVIAPASVLVLPISGSTMKGYQNATTGRVSVTYTGHNAALKASVLRR
jgi:hypothetical protein